MSKNINNIKKKKAIKRKNDSLLKLNNFDLKLDDNLLCIGVIIKDFSNIEFINQINKICSEYIGVDFAFFLHNNFVNNLSMCPIFDLRSLIQWNYPLITTDVSTTKTGMISKSNNIYFLMKDIETIPEEILQDKRIKLIFKTQNMLDVVIKNPKIENGTVIDNFSIMEIIKLINKDF